MRIYAKRTLLRVAFATIVAFVAMWGLSNVVKSSDSFADITCNPDATTIDNARCLQDVNDSVRASMEVGTPYTLADIRDGKSYALKKLQDGNVWMTQNLDLGTADAAITLDATDTDISIDSTFTTLPVAEVAVESNYYSVQDGYLDGGDKYLIFSGSWARDMVRDFGNPQYHIGNGYPWTVATAQTTSYVDSSDQTGIDMDPSDSICPAGWRLPSQSDYEDLLVAYELAVGDRDTEGSEDTSIALRGEPFNFVRSFPYELGTEGHYWTSTTSLDTDHYVARVFFINGYGAGPNTVADEISGAVGTIRCIARPESDFTLSYNMNGGTGSIADEVISSNHKRVDTTVSTTEPTRANHDFMGWAESSSATVAEYSGGDDIALGGDKILYAVWEVAVSDQVVTFEQSSVSKTYGDSDFTNAATTTGDGTITYSSSNTSVAEINANTGKVTIRGAGTATITANASATDYYRAASATYTLNVAKATPTVSFTNTSVTKTYGDAAFTNAATTTSDGAITYQSGDTSVATINSSTGKVTIRGAGTATITATAAATGNYNSASATYTLTVNRDTPTIAFANTSVTKTYGDAKFTNAATTVSDGAITYASGNTGVATIDSSTGQVTIVSAGTATITATVAATGNYDSASATYTLTVNKKTSTAPAEVSETKTGYMNDTLSTISLSTPGLAWSNSATKIGGGYNGYAVTYTENADTHNYTTESFEITVYGEFRSYEVTDGDGQTYTLNGDKEIIRFTVNANYGLFENVGAVYIDGVLLDSQNYTAEADGDTTIINLSHEFLEALSAGEHALAVHFEDGIAEAAFIVEAAEAEGDDEKEPEEEDLPVPNTGSFNHGNTGMNALICLLPGGVMAGILIGSYMRRAKKAHRKFDW